MLVSNLRTLTVGTILTQVLVVNVAEADQTDAVLIGVVRDGSTGKGLAGITVVATSPSLQGEKSVVTDDGGFYRIPNLPPGNYTLQVIGVGDKAETRGGIQLRAGTTIRKDVAVQTGSGETRKIEVEAPTVDVGSSSTGMRLDEEFTRRVPIAQPAAKGGAQRSFEAVAVATPTARADTYGTSVAGTTSPENAYLVDGISVGNPGYGINGSPLSVEFMQQVDVVNGGYMPEYGRAGGGVLSAVTKSGSNEFHGSLWAYYTPGQIEGKRKAIERAGQTVQTNPALSWIGDVGADIGGRLIKDRLWFYAGFDVARTVYDLNTRWYRVALEDDNDPVIDSETNQQVFEPIPNASESFKAESTNLQALAKLTFKANENHTLSLTGVFSPYWTGGDGKFAINGQTGNPEVLPNGIIGDYAALAHVMDGSSADLIAKWQATALNSKLTFDTTVGWHHQVDKILPSDGSAVGSDTGLAGLSRVLWRRNNPDYHDVTDFRALPNGADPEACEPVTDSAGEPVVRCPVVNWSTGGPDFIYHKVYDRAALRHVIGYSVRGAGHHLLKGGVDAEYIQYDNNRAFSGLRRYREATDGTNFLDHRQYGFLNGPDEPYVMNKLNWTTRSGSLGLFVQDSWAIMDVVTLNAGVRWDGQMLWAGDGSFMFGLYRMFSPRVGLIYDFTQKGKSKIYANYARYYQGVSLDVADRAGSSEPLIAGQFFEDGCDWLDPEQLSNQCRAPSNQVEGGAPSDPNQTWIVLNAGKEPIDYDIRAQTLDEVVAGAEYEVFKNARAGVNYNRRWVVRAIEDMSRDEANTYFLGNPGFGIATDFPKAKRIYDSVTFYFQKDFSKHWLTTVSYTLGWLRGNYVGLFRPETGQLDPNINSDFDLLSLLPNREGWLNGDHRHDIKVFAAGEIPLPARSFILLGTGMQFRSGAPSNYLGSHPRYGAGEAFILPRGTGERLPWLFNIDTNIGYRYQFNEDVSISVTMDVFNIINFQKATLVDENYTFSDVTPIPDGTPADLENLVDLSGAAAVRNPNFGNAVAYQRPRQFRFGLRLTF